MSFFKKLSWRLKKIISSIPYGVAALCFEPRLHPWRFMFDYVVLPAEDRYKKSRAYIQKYFSLVPLDNGRSQLSFGEVVLLIDDVFLSYENNLVSLLTLYFDLIYPGKVKFPIPLILDEGPYERRGVSLNPGDVVLDVGANLGFFSFYAAKKIGEKGKVYAFEPIPDVLQVLQNSIPYNGSAKTSIVPCPYAIGEKNAEVMFNFSPTNFGGASVYAKAGSSSRDIAVQQVTIDSFANERNLQKVDFIKMDIEGMERNALRGATEILKKYKPRLAICTYHRPDDPVEIRKIISEARPDYQFYQASHKLFAW
jgi:FkbM family methyltransferase